jgi:hypothetical protein
MALLPPSKDPATTLSTATDETGSDGETAGALAGNAPTPFGGKEYVAWVNQHQNALLSSSSRACR